MRKPEVGSEDKGRKRLLLVGGGHSHLFVLEAFAAKPEAGVELCLIGRDRFAPYSGMLPGLVAGTYETHETHIDLLPLAKAAGAGFVQDEVVALDLANRQVRTRAGGSSGFDILSLDIGSAPSLTAIPGAGLHAVGVKPVSGFLEWWQGFQRQHESGARPVAIVGGGAAGVELALAMDHAARTAGRSLPILLVSAGDLLPEFNRPFRRQAAALLRARSIEVLEGDRVTEVRAKDVRLRSGRVLPVEAVLFATAGKPQTWVRAAGLDADEDGFLLVDRALRSLSHPFVHAAGDIAHVAGFSRPKAGVFAVRQGPLLAENLRRAVQGKTPRFATPQKTALTILGTGENNALAAKGRFFAEGRWVWALKQRLDRRFMRRFKRFG